MCGGMKLLGGAARSFWNDTIYGKVKGEMDFHYKLAVSVIFCACERKHNIMGDLLCGMAFLRTQLSSPSHQVVV